MKALAIGKLRVRLVLADTGALLTDMSAVRALPILWLADAGLIDVVRRAAEHRHGWATDYTAGPLGLVLFQQPDYQERT